MPPLPPGTFEWILGIFMVIVILGVIMIIFKLLYPKLSVITTSSPPQNKGLEEAISQMIEEISKLRVEIEELKRELRE